MYTVCLKSSDLSGTIHKSTQLQDVFRSIHKKLDGIDEPDPVAHVVGQLLKQCPDASTRLQLRHSFDAWNVGEK